MQNVFIFWSSYIFQIQDLFHYFQQQSQYTYLTLNQQVSIWLCYGMLLYSLTVSVKLLIYTFHCIEIIYLQVYRVRIKFLKWTWKKHVSIVSKICCWWRILFWLLQWLLTNITIAALLIYPVSWFSYYSNVLSFLNFQQHNFLCLLALFSKARYAFTFQTC